MLYFPLSWHPTRVEAVVAHHASASLAYLWPDDALGPQGQLWFLSQDEPRQVIEAADVLLYAIYWSVAKRPPTADERRANAESRDPETQEAIRTLWSIARENAPAVFLRETLTPDAREVSVQFGKSRALVRLVPGRAPVLCRANGRPFEDGEAQALFVEAWPNFFPSRSLSPRQERDVRSAFTAEAERVVRRTSSAPALSLVEARTNDRETLAWFDLGEPLPREGQREAARTRWLIFASFDEAESRVLEVRAAWSGESLTASSLRAVTLLLEDDLRALVWIDEIRQALATERSGAALRQYDELAASLRALQDLPAKAYAAACEGLFSFSAGEDALCATVAGVRFQVALEREQLQISAVEIAGRTFAASERVRRYARAALTKGVGLWLAARLRELHVALVDALEAPGTGGLQERARREEGNRREASFRLGGWEFSITQEGRAAARLEGLRHRATALPSVGIPDLSRNLKEPFACYWRQTSQG